jgi:hypothetical protein
MHSPAQLLPVRLRAKKPPESLALRMLYPAFSHERRKPPPKPRRHSLAAAASVGDRGEQQSVGAPLQCHVDHRLEHREERGRVGIVETNSLTANPPLKCQGRCVAAYRSRPKFCCLKVMSALARTADTDRGDRQIEKGANSAATTRHVVETAQDSSACLKECQSRKSRGSREFCAKQDHAGEGARGAAESGDTGSA